MVLLVIRGERIVAGGGGEANVHIVFGEDVFVNSLVDFVEDCALFAEELRFLSRAVRQIVFFNFVLKFSISN